MRWSPRHLAVTVVAAMVALTGLTVAATPSQALASCPGSTGVVVVVDNQSLGGGAQQECVADGGGKSAAELFNAAGFSLTYVSTQPGFVCRVAGAPADASCAGTPPADAYWGLFVSDGRNGAWSYASSGAASLTVPDGGYVGFSWQSGTRVTPGVAPTIRVASTPTPSPTPTASAAPTTTPSSSPSPTKKPTKQPTGKPTKAEPSGKPTKTSTPTESATPVASGSAQPTTSPTATSSGSADPTESPSASPTKKAKNGKRSGAKNDKEKAASPSEATAEPTPAQASEVAARTAQSEASELSPDDSGLPLWVVLMALGLLAAGGVGAVILRSRRTT